MQWYRATHTNHSASFFLNGQLSAAYSVLAGVWQDCGLADDPRTSLETSLGRRGLQTRSARPLGPRTTQSGDPLYKRASGGKLSNSKPLLYPLGLFRDHPIAIHLGTWRAWRLSDLQFRVRVDTGEDGQGWEKVKSLTSARILATDPLPLAPASLQECFGLLPVDRSPLRLATDHAKWVFHLRDPDGCFIRHLFDIHSSRSCEPKPTPSFHLASTVPNPTSTVALDLDLVPGLISVIPEPSGTTR
ncbi:BQ2448_5149 [Microbotryum intermedium]|uniref:BQ2448_5149 protein n=1 Tax=Microbotryum intermedium TaxID=269621 RepID=A0A238F8P7_9BASI|nr:BQ2448_5149 [Microbotryum intermedium]